MQLGNQLRRERERRGLSIEKVSSQLRIPAEFLRAMERNDWNRLPSGYYRRAFLRTYAQFLHIPVAHDVLPPVDSVKPPRLLAWPSRPSIQVLGSVLVVIVLVALFVSGWWIHAHWNQAGLPAQNLSGPVPTRLSPRILSEADAIHISVPQPSPWIIRARRNGWVEIYVDGDQVFNGYLQEMDLFEVRVQKDLWVKATRARDVLDIYPAQ